MTFKSEIVAMLSQFSIVKAISFSFEPPSTRYIPQGSCLVLLSEKLISPFFKTDCISVESIVLLFISEITFSLKIIFFELMFFNTLASGP